jgi:hypothetical protein
VIKRVYIPKDEKSLRPLGLPVVEDKVVQMGIKRILEAIWEADFSDVSFGFRPNRGCHEALEEVRRTIMTRPVGYVVDMDIDHAFGVVRYRRPHVDDGVPEAEDIRPESLKADCPILEIRGDGRREVHGGREGHAAGRSNQPCTGQYLSSLHP